VLIWLGFYFLGAAIFNQARRADDFKESRVTVLPEIIAVMCSAHHSESSLFDSLVGGLEHEFYFSIQLGISSSQLTNSIIFQRGRAQPPSSSEPHSTVQTAWQNHPQCLDLGSPREKFRIFRISFITCKVT